MALPLSFHIGPLHTSLSFPPYHLLIVVLFLCRPATKTCIVDIVVRVVTAAVESLVESSIPPLPPLFVDCCFLCPGGMRRLALLLVSSALLPPPFIVGSSGDSSNRQRQKIFLLCHCCRHRCCLRPCHCCHCPLPVAVITLTPSDCWLLFSLPWRNASSCDVVSIINIVSPSHLSLLAAARAAIGNGRNS